MAMALQDRYETVLQLRALPQPRLLATLILPLWASARDISVCKITSLKMGKYGVNPNRGVVFYLAGNVMGENTDNIC